MAVLPMQRIQVIAPVRQRKAILEFLQRRNMVEIEIAAENGTVFALPNTAPTQSLLAKNAQTAQAAQALLHKYAPEKKGMLSFLEGRTAVTPAESAAFYAKQGQVLRIAQRIVQLEKEITEAKADIIRIEAQREALKPWLAVQVPLTFRGTKSTVAFIGSLEGQRTAEDITLLIAQADPTLPAFYVEPVSQSKTQTCVMVFAHRSYAQQAETAVRAAGLARPAATTSRIPSQKDAALQQKAQQAAQQIEAAKEEIASYAPHRSDLAFLEDHTLMREEKYAAIEKLQQSRHTFILSGYVLAENAQPLAEEINQSFTAYAEVSPIPQAETPPIALRNNWFSEPTETVLESYAMPGKGEIDPTTVMSFFYYIMFGLMFSDAGYGLIMAAVCGFCLLKFKNMEPNWSKNVRMFFWCGISTMFWGVVFSSYFGDVVDSVSSTFFGRTISIPPLWFAPLDEPMKLLIFCIAIGLVHLTAAYAMKGVTCFKNKDYTGILYDSVVPAVIIYPLLVVLLGSDIFYGIGGFKLNLSPAVTAICFGISAVCAVIIVLTGGRESKSWVKRILKGIYALYNNLSGWLSDALSYSRLLALGLATGVIGSVMNQLAAMAGGNIPFVGFFVYLVVFIAGHAMNFGINVLGAYVHSNRLEFVEFFGKFYDGGGRKFAPLGVHTKHYKIIEEENQNV